MKHQPSWKWLRGTSRATIDRNFFFGILYAKGFILLGAVLLSACVKTHTPPVPKEAVFLKRSPQTSVPVPNVPAVGSSQSSRSSVASSVSSSAYSVSSASASSAKEQIVYAVPPKVLLHVPFAPQAPFADWDDPRQQEGCEEMSAIMVHRYFQEQSLSKEEALEELLEFSTWQTERGFGLDVTMQELAKHIEERYGYRTFIDTDVTVERIQWFLSNGFPVIVPAAGKELKNPYFTDGGPWYHTLVVTGYTSKEFITNDPGTKRGEGYRYPYNTLINAIHNWTGVKQQISTGEKLMLIVSP